LEFVGDDLPKLMRAADLVITRAGMSTLSELAALGKAAIVIPIPNSHQEENAAVFYKNNAAVYYEQKNCDKDDFVTLIKDILDNPAKPDNLSLNIKKIMPTDAAEKMSDIILKIIRV